MTQQHCGHECVCGSYELGMDDLEIQCQEPCRIAKCEHDTRSRPAPQQPEREYQDDDCIWMTPEEEERRIRKHERDKVLAEMAQQPPATADAVLDAYIADILEAVKIMRSESATVKGDANKTREKVYHDGALFAYDRMQQYLERKAALRARERAP